MAASGRLDQTKHQIDVLATLIGLGWVPGIVVHVPSGTTGRIEVLTEVLEDVLPPGGRGLGIAGHFLKKLQADFALRDGLSGEELLQLLHVLQAVECDAMSLASVPTGPARLLIVGFERLGHVVMNDVPDVRLVDAHPEGDGRDDHVHVLHQELVLDARPLGGVHAGVVGGGAHPIDLECLGDFLHLLAAEAIHDAAPSTVLQRVLDDLPQGLHLRAHLVEEVGPVEAGLVDVGVEDAEVLLDVVLDLGGRGGGQGDDGVLPDAVDDVPEPAVFRPEVMPPFGNAVGFVDGEEAEPDRPEEVCVVGLVQGFGGHVEQLRAARGHRLLHTDHLGLAQGAVQIMGDVGVIRMAPDGIDLILHEGDERAHHNRRPLLNEGRQLVAVGLASTRRHDHEDVLAVHQAVDHLFLLALELIKTEEPGQTLLHGGPHQGRSIHERVNRRLHLTLASSI